MSAVIPLPSRFPSLDSHGVLMEMHTRLRLAIVPLTFCLLAVAGIYVARSPVRNAAKIQNGDSKQDVRRLLGEPDAVFRSTEELRSSQLRPMSYVFTDRSGRTGIPFDELPDSFVHVEWYGYASAGHLVYYNESGVSDVFWGGT